MQIAKITYQKNGAIFWAILALIGIMDYSQSMKMTVTTRPIVQNVDVLKQVILICS